MFWRINLNIPKGINYILSSVVPLSISLFYAYIIIFNKEAFNKQLYKSEGVVINCVDTVSLAVSAGFVYFGQFCYFIRRSKLQYFLQRTDMFCSNYTIKTPNLPLEYISILICAIFCYNNFIFKSTFDLHVLITVNMIFRATQTYLITYMFRLYKNVYKEINAQINTICLIRTSRKTIEMLVKNVLKMCLEGNGCLKQLNDLFDPLFVGIFCLSLGGFISDVYHVSFLTINSFNGYEELELSVLKWKAFRIVVGLAMIISIIHVCSNLVEEVSI